MFLTDGDVTAMTGIRQEEHKPVRLKNWLKLHGYVEDVTFFRRVDGWYSVMAPQARAAVEPVRAKVRRRA
jgi:hypothetical protein